MSLQGKKIVVGLTGGIACYKIPILVRLLRKAGAEVQVIMTEAATRFITPLTLESVSDRPVGVELFPKDEFVSTRHIDYSDWAELIVVAPATANFLGKMATGISDDLLTTVVCAHRQPLLIAPAMNPGMWENKVTQKNYEYLESLGHKLIDPVEGEMACDHVGVGRMAEPEDIFSRIVEHFSAGKKKVLAGKRILITAGPTREKIDSVRYISNYSSGKMGYALAEAAIELGAEVTLISGPSAMIAPSTARVIHIESTEDLHRAVEKEFTRNDCLIMSAAPADFQPTKIQDGKIRRNGKGLELSLKPTVDILKSISNGQRKGKIIVGFALEIKDGVANAKKKLKEKNLDAIVVNTLTKDSGFNTDTNRVTFIFKNGEPESWPLQTKSQVAVKVLEKISSLL
jgi:phosphopantothenoylcysteine decarboxylase/phosphopantothenate--cysteine ligase